MTYKRGVILRGAKRLRRISGRGEMVGYVYFMSNRPQGVIYIGVTSNLLKRVWEHREHVVVGFTQRYKLDKLVYYEVYDDIETAILYEKKLKNIHRQKKIAIIERANPQWHDLWEEITGTVEKISTCGGDPAQSLRASQDDDKKHQSSCESQRDCTGSQQFLLPTEADTARLARIIAVYLRPVDCLTLTGNIGAGKTTLMRYVIGALQDSGLGIQDSGVISPSFMIMQAYDVGIGSGVTEQGDARSVRFGENSPIKKTTLYHVDGYRLNDASEIPELGLEECFESGIVAIEWPELFAGWLPHNRLDIVIELGDADLSVTEQGDARSGRGTGGQAPRLIKIIGRGSHANTAFAIGQEFHGNT